MADGSSSGGSGGFMAFIVGGLVVVVAVLGFFMFTGGHMPGASATKNLNVSVSSPNLPKPGK